MKFPENAAGALGSGAAKGKGGKNAGKGGAAAAPGTAPAAAPLAGEDVRKLIEVDVFAIEIGCGLLGLADLKTGGDLLASRACARTWRATAASSSRRSPCATTSSLASSDYRFLIRSKAVARGQPACAAAGSR